MKFVFGSLVGSTILLALSGCNTTSANSTAYQEAKTSGFPVHYQYSVAVNDNGVIRARDELDAYLLLNRNALAVYGAEIFWHGEVGEKLAQKSYRWLIRQGTPEDKLSMVYVDEQPEDTVTVSTTIYQAHQPDCAPSSQTLAMADTDGCVVQTLRWENDVYPETELAGEPGKNQFEGVAF